MSSKTFLQLQTALASMWGSESPSDLLTQDLEDIKMFINSAYFDCFAPVDGTRPSWPTSYFTDLIKAAVPATLTLTQGSKAVTGFTFEDKYAGSFVKIGDRMFRYATASTLMQTWDLASGDYTATVFHNSIKLPASVLELAGVPSLLGVGALAPLPDPDSELYLRTAPAGDFNSRDGGSVTRRAFSNSSYLDVGEPRYYHIDQTSITSEFSISNRFCVYPLPDQAYTFELRANITPTSLEKDEDVPVMPANAIENILLPLARERLAENSSGRRYTGPNLNSIIRAADRARAQLASMSSTQRDRARCFRTRKGW